MAELLVAFLLEMVLAPLVSLVWAALWFAGRMLVLATSYPLLLLLGWLRLWVRERGSQSLCALWRAHGPGGLQQFGWQQLVRDAQHLLAALLLALAAGGLGLVLYYLAAHVAL
jgi:hypothetical protein